MRRFRRLRWHFRLPYRLWGRREKQTLHVLVAMVLVIILFIFLNTRIYPVVVDLASVQLRNMVTRAINDVVSEYLATQNLTYNDLVRFEKDDQGRIAALTSNMAAFNQLRFHSLTNVMDKLNETDFEALRVPIGNLTGMALLSGHGPGIPVRIVSVNTVSASFDSVFSATGINQTRHSILLDMVVSVHILMPGYTTKTNVEASVYIAETVIVGSVPEHYTYFNLFGTDQTAGENNYDFTDQ